MIAFDSENVSILYSEWRKEDMLKSYYSSIRVQQQIYNGKKLEWEIILISCKVILEKSYKFWKYPKSIK